MPREVFVAGQVLTAAELNVVSDQSVMVFAGTAARGSAIPSPTEGMVTYRSDDDVVEVYNGSSFVPVGPGQILQVVQTTKTDAFSASVAAGAESGAVFSASITPSSTSSKVLVLISAQIAGSGTEAVYATLFRDSSVVTAATGDAEGSRKRVTSGGGDAVDSRLIASAMISFLDSPATTSSTTYDFRIAHGSGLTRTLYANRSAANDNSSSDSRSMSTITLMEVAG